MYWSKIKFKGNDNFKEFKVNFSDGDNLNGVIFKKEKNYFITSLSANVEIDKDLKGLKDYKKIKELSRKSNEIIEKGISHLHKDILLEINLKDVDLLPDKKKRKLAVKSLEFFDEKTQKKKKVSIYSQYEELKIFGLEFVKENGIIYKYTINLFEDRKNNLFLEKNFFFDKNQVIEKIKKEYDYKNTFFIEHNGKLKAHTIGFTEFLAKHIDHNINFDFMSIFRNRSEFPLYFYENLLGGSSLFPKRKRPKYIFTKGDSSALTDLHPLAINLSNVAIKGGVNFYITPELYEKDHSIFKRIPEIQSKNVTTTSELDDLRRELTNNDFSVSKLYGFRNIKAYSIYPILNINNFIMPDFNVKITIKKGKEKIEENIKKIFEGSFYVLDNEFNTSKKTEIISKNKRSAEIKNTIPEKIEEYLSGEYSKSKKLSEEINLKSFDKVYENFFLYDLENIIKPTFTTELQIEFSIYGLINFSGKIDNEKKIKLISPKNYLKFDIEREIYKNQLKMELNKVHNKKTFNILDNNVFNFGILTAEKKRKIGEKRIMTEIIDSFTILGIQKLEYSYLNPVHINIKSENIIRKLMSNKNNKYKFILKSLIFSSNILNDTDVIFLISSGLSDAKKVFIDDKLESAIGVCYLSEVKDWDIIKGQSKRVQVVFFDSEDFAGQSNHFSLAFETRNLSDILKFSITLVDGENKPIKFKDGEDKVPIITFDIQIIK